MVVSGKAAQLDDEALDFQDSEVEELESLAGTRMQNPRFQKVLSGLFEITQGLSGSIAA